MRKDTRLGILLMIATVALFALQDGFSTHLASAYNVWMVVMIRFWFLAALVLTLAGARGWTIRSGSPGTQVVRGLLLVGEIAALVTAFTLIGLVQSHAIFTAYPLLVAALSGPVLGERVGWRRWAAIGVGFAGVLLILRPGIAAFDPRGVVALLSATMFALYGLLTRRVARTDGAATSFFWTGIVGAVTLTPVGLWHWEPMTVPDMGVMAALCVSGALAHFLLIKTYEVAEASAVQPFAFLQLVFAAAIGVWWFGEMIDPYVVAGAAVVVGAGLFTLWRERVSRPTRP